MQLANHRALSILEELLPERPLLRALAQTQQSYQNIPLWILVTQKCLPTTVCNVVAANELEFVGLFE